MTGRHNLSKPLGSSVLSDGERDYKADEQLIRLNGTITNTLYLSCTLSYGPPPSPPRSFRQSVVMMFMSASAIDRVQPKSANILVGLAYVRRRQYKSPAAGGAELASVPVSAGAAFCISSFGAS